MASYSPIAASNPLPASFLRGGTSKGIYLNQNDLPSDKSLWNPIFLGIMGSPDPEYKRQLNGMGGGISSLSKICVVRPAQPKEREELDVDVEYTFVQVGIHDSEIDISGNCGNLSSMIGVFAVDEGMCKPRLHGNDHAGKETLGSIRAFNTNTHKVIETTFPLRQVSNPSSELIADLDIPQTTIAGVPGKASKIVLDFHNPSGARTGKLLPTGNAQDLLELSDSKQISASLVDATNPTVIVPYSQLEDYLPASSLESYTLGKPSKDVDDVLESLRREGAKKMGLDPTAQAQPKIAIVSASSPGSDTENGVDVVVHALSMAVLHKAVPMTLGLCLGVAAHVKGTLVWDIVQRSRISARIQEDKDTSQGLVRLRHPSGIVDVGARFDQDGSVISAQVVRTGRRLMKGHVWW
ncbi:hypothetical protein PQX77_004931 [Marasmius sp. AFHP31]|nr:hypothetical protein PQX77_004931 [Marasmius sp. AFHP31]